MNILIVTNYFPPEIGAASYLYYDLAETLAELGHRVTVVTGFARYRMGENTVRGFLHRDRVGQSEVVRVVSSSLDRGGPVARGLDHLYLAPSLLAGGLVAGTHEIVLAYSPPLTLGLTAYALSKAWRVPFVVNVQDLFPQYAVDIGLMTNRSIIRAFEALERFVYRTADAIITNSPGSRVHVLKRGGVSHSTHVVSNWVDLDAIVPGPRGNLFRQQCGLGDSFVVQYAGTMGYQQDLDTVLNAATILRTTDGIRFQLVGDGVERGRLCADADRRRLSNVVFTPFQPRERFPEVVQAADACVVSLRKEVKTPAIPSKLLTIMAAGKPAIVSTDPGGDAPAIVEEAACGICVPPGDPEAFASAVRQLSHDRDLAADMGRRGRRYAEEHFSRSVCVAEYSRIFQKVARSSSC